MCATVHSGLKSKIKQWCNLEKLHTVCLKIFWSGVEKNTICAYFFTGALSYVLCLAMLFTTAEIVLFKVGLREYLIVKNIGAYLLASLHIL